MRTVADFIRRLRDNNDRAWFDAHRAEWQEVKTRFAAFTERLIEGIASFDPSVRGLRPQDCTYRIARDTRFSADKSPYKSWIGAYVAPHGKQSGYAGYYFHIEPSDEGVAGNSLISAGLYCPEPKVLRSVREDILDNGPDYIRALVKAEGFRLCRENTLKRTPTGFPSGTEYDDLLRLKDLYLERKTGEDFLFADDLLERTVEEFRRTKNFIRLLNRAVRFAHEEM